MNFKNIKICSKTVMDTTDPNISFNEKGESNYYTNYLQNILPSWKNNGSKLIRNRRKTLSNYVTGNME